MLLFCIFTVLGLKNLINLYPLWLLMHVKDVLKDWALNYVKNRDLVHNLIKEIVQDSGFDFIVHRMDGSLFFLVIPELSDVNEIVDKAGGKRLNVVVLNTKENLDFLVKHWKSLIKFPDLCFYFVNPKSSDEQKWIVYPRSHDLIIDSKHLKKSLNVLFSAVPVYK